MGTGILIVLVIAIVAAMLTMMISESAKELTLATTKFEHTGKHCD